MLSPILPPAINFKTAFKEDVLVIVLSSLIGSAHYHNDKSATTYYKTLLPRRIQKC